MIDLLARRIELNASRAAVATAAGLTVAKVWRIENNRPKTTDDERTLVANTLDKMERNEIPRSSTRGRHKAEETATVGGEGSSTEEPAQPPQPEQPVA